MLIRIHGVRRFESAFFPSRLSKTDRQTHLGSPISILRLPASTDASVCPVGTLEDYLHRRANLHVAYDFVFCAFGSPHGPISTAGFSGRLWWVLHQSGIGGAPWTDMRRFRFGRFRLRRRFDSYVKEDSSRNAALHAAFFRLMRL